MTFPCDSSRFSRKLCTRYAPTLGGALLSFRFSTQQGCPFYKVCLLRPLHSCQHRQLNTRVDPLKFFRAMFSQNIRSQIPVQKRCFIKRNVLTALKSYVMSKVISFLDQFEACVVILPACPFRKCNSGQMTLSKNRK